MIWNITFLDEALEDLKKLDGSVRVQVLKGIRKVSQNPLPASQGGYGKPLGHKNGTNKFIPQTQPYNPPGISQFPELSADAWSSAR